LFVWTWSDAIRENKYISRRYGLLGAKCHYFSNEAELGYFIRLILNDVLNGLRMRQLVSLSYETSFGPDKGNILVVRNKLGVPISVIEGKQPSPDKLSNDKLLGQVFDYLSNFRNNFG
jgi:hypothetical protein